jgi:hypothetical protein
MCFVNLYKAIKKDDSHLGVTGDEGVVCLCCCKDADCLLSSGFERHHHHDPHSECILLGNFCFFFG